MNDAALDNKYQYNGKEWNDDFGLNLNDYGARWYDGAVGRWWSVDPMGEKRYANNPFAYVNNNPLVFIDPNGMEDQKAIWWDNAINNAWNATPEGNSRSFTVNNKSNNEKSGEDET